MKLEIILNNYLNRWPEIVKMDGARIVAETNGFLSPDLIFHKDLIEEEGLTEIDRIACISIYTCYHRIMKELIMSGVIRDIRKSEITYEKLAKEFLKRINESENDKIISSISKYEI